MEFYENPANTPEARASDLLGKLSLEEKMAQVQCYFYHAEDVAQVRVRFPYGVGGVSCLEMRTCGSLEEAAEIQRRIQRDILDNSPHGIPALFHMEGLCGLLVQDASSFPCGLGRAASFDPELEEQVGRTVSRQAAALGISHVFAPVLDVSHNPRFGRYGETYGEDPTLASALGCAYTRGIQNGDGRQLRPESVAKHFVGSHENEAGLHTASAPVPPRKLREIYAKPFQAAITEAKLKGVMPCYNAVDGIPVSGDKRMLTGLLREEMGFDGLTVSDYGAIENLTARQRVCQNRTEAGRMALDAGMDMELPQISCYGDGMKELFRSGKLDTALLDRAVRRILEAKFRMGLFEHPFALQGPALKTAFHRKRDREISRQSALESMVLLKNDGILPIREAPDRIAVIGWHAGTIRSMFGGYTHLSMAEGLHGDLATMAGITPEGHVQRKDYPRYPDTYVTDEGPFRTDYEALASKIYPKTKTLVRQLRETFPASQIDYAYGCDFAGTDESHFPEALALAEQADLVILTLGGKHGTGFTCAMGENVDSTSINLPPCQERLIQEVCRVCRKVVGVHLDGRPISSDYADRYLNAILESWSPAEYGAEAICDILTGAYAPSGRLPVTVARNAGQTPIYYNQEHNSGYRRSTEGALPGYVDCAYSPRYPFGFGLSYTRFSYSDLALDKDAYSPADTAIITLTVTNTGDRTGTETVQLYVSDEIASTVQPVMELAGFLRLTLEAGARKNICFRLSMRQLALLDRDMRWKIEAGRIQVMVGASSEDIRLEHGFEILEDLFLESGRDREYYAKAEVLE